MKKKMTSLAALLLALLMSLSLLSACGGNDSKQGTDGPAPAGDTNKTDEPAPAPAESSTAVSDDDVDGELIVDHEEELQYAQEFSMTHYKGGYISFRILGGEHEEKVYLVVPEGKTVPAGLGEEYVVLQQPVTNLRCCSGSASTISAFGGLDRVNSLGTDADGVAIPALLEAFENGGLVYSGSYKEPDYELILDLGTQLVIDANNLDGNPDVTEKYTELGIPYLPIRNAKEPHPLGYNEWAKVFGAVLGMWDEANAYFDAQIEMVNAVTTDEELGKTVAIVYYSTDGTKVYARRGGDAYAAMVDLAGGEYIMKDFEPEDTGVATITMEDYFALCKDADYLINLNLAAHLYTIDELLEIAPFMEDFQSVKDGNVYVARDRISQFGFDNAGIISDMNEILKDDTLESTTYFSKMK